MTKTKTKTKKATKKATKRATKKPAAKTKKPRRETAEERQVRGRMERAFAEKAQAAGFEPGPYMKHQIESGVTQDEIAQSLGCSRQAVSAMARRYGYTFPGARIDLDMLAQAKGFKTFKRYLAANSGSLSQDQMAVDLDCSPSTLKRRIKAVNQEG